jgi:nucleoside-diphosphate kinase
MQKERTLVIVKPDGVQRSLIGEVVTRFERVGLKLSALKLIVPTKEQVEAHYASDPEWTLITGQKAIDGLLANGGTPRELDPQKFGEDLLERLVKYFTSGPVVVMVWQGAHAVEVVRKLVGGTEPRVSDVGTLRGDYMLDSYVLADRDGRAVRNLVHASSSTKEALVEIENWFDTKEVQEYALVQDKILYDVNLDGIIE